MNAEFQEYVGLTSLNWIALGTFVLIALTYCIVVMAVRLNGKLYDSEKAEDRHHLMVGYFSCFLMTIVAYLGGFR